MCPFHGDCFEGLAAGPAMEKRWGQRAENLPANHPAWNLESDYIASALMAYAHVLSPERIIIGGGIGQLAHLLPRIQQKTRAQINNYIQSPIIQNEIERYIVNPGLGGRAGVLGAIALAQNIETT
jgi:fructokinase